jgi:hypothetical protein
LQVQTAGVGVHEGGQGQAATTDAWRRRRPRGAIVEEVGASLPGGLEEMCAILVWKRWGRVIRAARAVDLKWVVRMRARKMELARTAHESKRTERSSRGRPDVRTLVNPFLKSLI